VGQQGVLLGFVPAVNLVDEQDGLLVVELAALLGLDNDLAQIGHAG